VRVQRQCAVFSASNATTQSTLKCGNSRSGDLYVMILGIRADADRADYLTIHNDRKPALHFDETTRSCGRDAPNLHKSSEYHLNATLELSQDGP
jgi:hypothetical protein